MDKILIILEGGLVQGVITEKECEVLVCDYDVDGAELEEISFNPYGESCYFRPFKSEPDKEILGKFFDVAGVE